MTGGRRVVVVIGPGSPVIETALRDLRLSPLDSGDGNATIWMDLEEISEVGPAMEDAPKNEPLLVTIPVAAASLGIGRSTVYELISRGELDVVHIGKAVRVTVVSLEDFVCRNSRAAGKGLGPVPRTDAKLHKAAQSGISQPRRLPLRSV
jgi:excisionase family DNA binding protein